MILGPDWLLLCLRTEPCRAAFSGGENDKRGLIFQDPYLEFSNFPPLTSYHACCVEYNPHQEMKPCKEGEGGGGGLGLASSSGISGCWGGRNSPENERKGESGRKLDLLSPPRFSYIRYIVSVRAKIYISLNIWRGKFARTEIFQSRKLHFL